jgi:phage gp46-like protein
MIDNQQGDVKLFNTADNGDIEVTDGITTMDPGLGTAAYLSLFGGNENDSGLENDPAQWWGNYSETEPAKKYRSVTQYILKTLPATSNNLLRVEEAALKDLAWLTELNVANEVTVAASIPALNRIHLEITITANGVESSFKFTENWKASA